ncbi:MAG: serine protease [Oscillospiraceae bacterium]|nr:serine protease [Oscillospiraceae bacterium]
MANATQEELTAEAQYARAQDSLLYIRSYYASGGLRATGSGFVVTADGLAVTAAHVVDKGARVTALTKDGRELEAAVVRCDVATDVAVLRLPTGRYSASAISKSAPSGGAVLRAMGYPIKDAAVITEGLLSAPAATVSGKQRMLVTCDIVNGMSGGPIFDRFGKVVGMASGSVRTMDGIHLSALWSDLDAAVSAAQKGQ